MRDLMRRIGWSAGVGLAMLLAQGASATLIDSFTYGSHAYRIYGGTDSVTNWAAAQTFAASLNLGGSPGYLARVDDAGENGAIVSRLALFDAQFTQRAMDGGGARYVWIGGSDIAAEGVWRWSNNGQQFWQGPMPPAGYATNGLYNNWGTTSAQNEPDGMTSQNAAGIGLDGWPFGAPPQFALGTVGQWNDIDEDNNMPFVVEFDAIPEPATLWLLGAGLSLISMRRRVKG